MPRRGIHQYLGDAFLENLVKECDNSHKKSKRELADYLRKRDKALVATLFLTGGFVSEILSLRKNNFVFNDKEAKKRKAFIVKDMKVLYQKEKRGKPKWVTRTIELFYDEPLVQYLLDWIKLIPEADGKLFNLNRISLWRIIRNLGERLNCPISSMDLRNQRMLYLVEKRGLEPFEVQRHFGMELNTPNSARAFSYGERV